MSYKAQEIVKIGFSYLQDTRGEASFRFRPSKGKLETDDTKLRKKEKF